MDDAAPDPGRLADALAAAFTRMGRGTLRALTSFGQAGLDYALPPTCMACTRAVSEPGGLCASCWGRLDFITEPLCHRLGIPLHEGESRLSPAALEHPPAYGRARAAASFGEVARDLVHGLKYADRTDLADPLAGLMARAGAELLHDAEALVPVPLHPRRLFRRRFNQSALLALGIERRSGVPMRAGWLARTRATTPQVGLDRAARAGNVAGAFAVPEAARAEVAGRCIVLVDDVLTTGATIDACAKALMRAGAKRVDVLVFARVVDAVTTPIS
ncbi:ComF family protein [Ancylobacter defluvii]|uniref:Amidophosphoribosyltransferase n=1 Tax=Ancylobacter defluvii TaxID=1282440 RepID=A0A9W6JQP9_9HYPH|nr:ComF family protein [Ancylobacter defluvii]MBS7587317.1 ComF family protein [Ancylobacter defluvii]GLK82006.1 amidophosphoribosyltransferase [Ancylobacter defluvii]